MKRYVHPKNWWRAKFSHPMSDSSISAYQVYNDDWAKEFYLPEYLLEWFWFVEEVDVFEECVARIINFWKISVFPCEFSRKKIKDIVIECFQNYVAEYNKEKH